MTVIIPCRDHAEELRRCLSSLAPQVLGTAHRVMVVDSASDEVVLAVTREFPFVDVARSSRALLAGGARNLGAQHATGEYLGFIDADCIALPGWIDAGIQTLQNGAKLAGGPIMDRLPFHPVAAADNLLQFTDFAGTRKSGPINHVPSCNVAIRRADFEAVGGFPADTATGHDVVFVATVLSRWPARLCYSREMRIRHAGRQSVAALCRHQYAFGKGRAEQRLMIKAWQLRVGAWWAALPFVMAKRLGYIIHNVSKHRPHDLLRLPLLLPMTLVGLAAYAAGFRDGCCRLRKAPA